MLNEKCVVAFADIAGSTRLYETLGDAMAKSLITGVQTKISSVVRRLGGHVQEIVGDEVMFMFEQANHGASCACQIQEVVDAFATESSQPIAVRIGIHFGEAIEEQGRVFGDTINTASRLAGIAQGGQIIGSEEFVSQLSGEMQAMARRFDKVKVKGKQDTMLVYDLLWKHTSVTLIDSLLTRSLEDVPTMTLRYGEQSFYLHDELAPFKIGRSLESQLVLVYERVSRNHANIGYNRGRFVLTDTSTNGTYVLPENGEPIYLRRESLPLWGNGQIGLGAPVSDGRVHVLGFACG